MTLAREVFFCLGKKGRLRRSRLILLINRSAEKSEDPRVPPTRGAPNFIFRTYLWATPSVTKPLQRVL